MLPQNKVVWAEGMFIKPQHFQQQERYFENLLKAIHTSVNNHAWGIIYCEFDQSLLSINKVSITKAAGVLEDGTYFNIPNNDIAPTVLSVPPNTQNMLIYLGAPLSQSGRPEITAQPLKLSRFHMKEHEVNDNASEELNPTPIAVAQLNLQLLLDSDDRRQFACLPIARIKNISSAGEIQFDDNFIAPCLDYKSSTTLVAFIREIKALLQQRSDALAKNMGDINRSNSAVSDFLMLQMINRINPLLIHLEQQPYIHPEELYKILLSFSSELATFTSSEKRLSIMNRYDHRNLQNTYRSLMFSLRNSLSTVIERIAFALPLEKRDYGILMSTIHDRSLLDGADFVLAVNASIPTESLLSRFPNQIKIGCVEHIRELITAQLPGIKLQTLNIAPPQIPYNTGFSYFKLDFSNKELEQIKKSGGIAFNINGDYPDLQLEFWAIRRR
jgi:type VI secretion system protein ImpJ